MANFFVWMFNAPDDRNLPTWVRVFSVISFIIGTILSLGISGFLLMLFCKLFPYPFTTILLTTFIFFLAKLVMFYRKHATIKETHRS